jgi:hypothetical protein
VSDRGNQGNQGGRGFAGMDDEKQREIAAEGGRAAHEKGTAHEFTSEGVREAGRKGGQARGGDGGGQGRRRAGQVVGLSSPGGSTPSAATATPRARWLIEPKS